jgi:hypothetical protein
MAKCDGRMEVFSRVVGYYAPTTQWNKGKREEFKDRVTFKPNRKEESSVAEGTVREVGEGIEGEA